MLSCKWGYCFCTYDVHFSWYGDGLYGLWFVNEFSWYIYRVRTWQLFLTLL